MDTISEVQLRWNSGGIDQRSPLLGWSLPKVRLYELQESGRRSSAAAGLHLALGWALRRPPVLVEHWEAGVSLSSTGEGSGRPRPNPVESPFFIINFGAINIFSFPFWIQILVQVGGS